MVDTATRVTCVPGFDQGRLRQELMLVASRRFYVGDGINAAIAEGWYQAVGASLADGIPTCDDEERLQESRDRFVVQAADAAETALEAGARDRVMLGARLTALSTCGSEAILRELAEAVRSLTLNPREGRDLLVTAWEAALEGSMEDGVLSLDEEVALVCYLKHFELSVRDVDRNRAHRNMVKSAAIRELAEGIIPDRLASASDHPFNLMTSERIVWLFDGVEYPETKTSRE